MAKVFTGKVLISGDEIKDYLQLMKQAEKEKEPFREMLDRLNQEFEAYLTEQFSVKTARKHSRKTALFIDFYAGIPMSKVLMKSPKVLPTAISGNGT